VAVLCFILKAFTVAKETVAEEELTVPKEYDVQLPNTAEVEAERERRRRFDEEWSGINELLSSVPLEPLVVNVSTKPDDDEQPGESVPRTTTEMADEIFEILTSRF